MGIAKAKRPEALTEKELLKALDGDDAPDDISELSEDKAFAGSNPSAGWDINRDRASLGMPVKRGPGDFYYPSKDSLKRGGDDESDDDSDRDPRAMDLEVEQRKGGLKCISAKQLAFRSFLVLGVSLVPMVITDLTLTIDLFGSLLGSTLTIILPNFLAFHALDVAAAEEKVRKECPPHCNCFAHSGVHSRRRYRIASARAMGFPRQLRLAPWPSLESWLSALRVSAPLSDDLSL